jgi:hypothetical protein
MKFASKICGSEMPSLIFLSAGTDQASSSKLCANAVTSKSLNPRDALDAVVILSGAEGDKKLAGDPNADPLLAELQLS